MFAWFIVVALVHLPSRTQAGYQYEYVYEYEYEYQYHYSPPIEPTTVSISQPSVYGTVINTTIHINDAPLNEVVETLNDTVISYLIAKGISTSLITAIIKSEDSTTMIVAFVLSDELETGIINKDEIEREVKDDLYNKYEDNVVVADIDIIYNKDDKKQEKSGDGLYILYAVLVIILCVISLSVIIVIGYQYWTKRQQYNQSEKSIQSCVYKANGNGNEPGLDAKKGERDSIEIIYDEKVDIPQNEMNNEAKHEAHLQGHLNDIEPGQEESSSDGSHPNDHWNIEESEGVQKQTDGNILISTDERKRDQSDSGKSDDMYVKEATESDKQEKSDHLTVQTTKGGSNEPRKETLDYYDKHRINDKNDVSKDDE